MFKPGEICTRLSALGTGIKPYARWLRQVPPIIALMAWSVMFPFVLHAFLNWPKTVWNFTFDVGGALGGVATLVAAAIAWRAVKMQIADEQKARQLDALDARMVSVIDREEGLTMARNFVHEEHVLATATIGKGNPDGRSIVRGHLTHEETLKWLSTLSSDPFALGAMTVRSVEARKYVWWTIRRAEAFGKIALQVTKMLPLNDLDEPALNAFDSLVKLTERALKEIEKEELKFRRSAQELAARWAALK